MRGVTPVEEISVKEIAENINKIYDEKRANQIKKRRAYSIEKLEQLSLAQIANNMQKSCYLPYDYLPYLVDFEFIMDRLKNDYDIDKGIESFEVKSDIVNQLKKMKSIPPFSTECHIESKYGLRCRSLKSFVLKNILRQKKYRLVFHNRDATFEHEYCKKDVKQFLYTLIFLIVMLIISLKLSIVPLCFLIPFLGIVIWAIWAMFI